MNKESGNQTEEQIEEFIPGGNNTRIDEEIIYKYKCSICLRVQEHIISNPELIMATALDYYYIDHKGDQFDVEDVGKAIVCGECWNELMDSIESIRYKRPLIPEWVKVEIPIGIKDMEDHMRKCTIYRHKEDEDDTLIVFKDKSS